jgi:hypothetical protein
MAKPRVFISSTFYDLRTVREDLHRFVTSQGFEPVRHETGSISYGKDEKPENYAYREVDLCEILVCIIGGKYGSHSSKPEGGSITQNELRAAFNQGKQVYIFVDDNVLHEYQTYQANKDNTSIKYTAVDNTKIYNFLDEIYALPHGNPIFPFIVSTDITKTLQEQWAGLFQRLLAEYGNKKQAVMIEELQKSLSTVGQLVNFLSSQNNTNATAFDTILMTNHPFFDSLKKVLNNTYRIYFPSLNELDEWLTSAKGYVELPWIDDNSNSYGWWRQHQGTNYKLTINKDIFDNNGSLKLFTVANWTDDFINHEITTIDHDDDIPF